MIVYAETISFQRKWQNVTGIMLFKFLLNHCTLQYCRRPRTLVVVYHVRHVTYVWTLKHRVLADGMNIKVGSVCIQEVI